MADGIKLKIGVLLRAGLGDTVQLSMYVRGIKKRWPNSEIYLFCRYEEVFRNNPDIAGFGDIKRDNWFEILQHNKNKYDIFYDLRYGGNAYYNNKSTQELINAAKLQSETFDRYRWLYDNFLVANSRLATLNEPIWKVVSDSINVECSPDDMFVEVSKTESDYVDEFCKERKIEEYVTVHDWAMFGKQTKCWVSEKWNKVVKFLIANNMKVIQLGTAEEEPFTGAVNLLGRTSLHQTAAFLKKSKLHIDIEGGLVHVARAVGTKSIVLFGPTPESVFAYEGNISIRSRTCSPCFWKRTNWHVKCMEDKNCVCMKDLTELQVTDSICDIFGWKKTEREKKENNKILNIGVERTGGIGDGAYAVAACAAIKRKYPQSKISVFASPMTKKAFIGRPEISALHDHVHDSNTNNFDIYYYLQPDGSMTINCSLTEEQMRWNKVRDKFALMKSDPAYSPNHLNKYGKHALDVINELFGLDAKLADMQIYIPGADRRWAKKQVQGQKVVTIHDWAFGFRQSKCWMIDKWAVVVDWLTKRGYTVYQLGGRGEDIIPYTVNMLGRLSITKSVALMLEGQFHVDNESSLAHYGAAFGHPTFVLLGPTMRYWHHKENFNIRAGTCHECEGYEGWTDRCPLGKNLECMKSITPEMVLKHIQQHVKVVSAKRVTNKTKNEGGINMKSLNISVKSGGDVHLEELKKNKLNLTAKDDQYDVVDCDRVLEYLKEEEVIHVLNEIRRVLKKDGTCKLKTLDLENLVQKYARREMDSQTFMRRMSGDIDGHRFEYLMDLKAVNQIIGRCGFKDIKNEKDPSGELLILEARRQ